MRTRARHFFGCLVVAAGLVFVSQVHAGEPLEVVKAVAEKAIQILKDPRLQSPDKKKERVDRLREVVKPFFDFEEMAKRALGRHWRQRTPAEQEEFVKLFRDFLEKIYSDRIDLYNGERVVFGREMIDQDFAQVESVLINAKNEELSVVYRLRRNGGKWKVYDAVVENISIVNNYRSQFDRVINSMSYEELVKRLRDKTA
jgi:phospholipid transport system substrate-binding protein